MVDPETLRADPGEIMDDSIARPGLADDDPFAHLSVKTGQNEAEVNIIHIIGRGSELTEDNSSDSLAAVIPDDSSQVSIESDDPGLDDDDEDPGEGEAGVDCITSGAVASLIVRDVKPLPDHLEQIPMPERVLSIKSMGTRYVHDSTTGKDYFVNYRLNRICGAIKRGIPCESYLVMESGRCRSHGGSSPGRPITTGMYSKVLKSKKLKEKLQIVEDAENPLDAMEELQVTRMLLADVLARYDPDDLSSIRIILETEEADNAFTNSYDMEELTRTVVLKLEDRIGNVETARTAYYNNTKKLAESIAKQIDMMIKQRNETALTAIEVLKIKQALEVMVNEFVPADRRGDFLNRLRTIISE
jgi:hypothetical protein